jgi:spondin N
MSMTARAIWRRVLTGTLSLAAIAAFVSSAAAAPPTWIYRVTIENLTPAHGTTGQVLSPALVVVHDRSFDLWSVGETALPAVSDVAEDANTSTGATAFGSINGVVNVSSQGTMISSGGSYTFEVNADNDGRYLSLVTMLGNTNDTFTGLDAIHLTGARKEYRVFAYDAGTEVNDQLRVSISGPCCNGVAGAGTLENGMIQRSQGILANTGDLTPEQWGWDVNQPVALITVERVRQQ